MCCVKHKETAYGYLPYFQCFSAVLSILSCTILKEINAIFTIEWSTCVMKHRHHQWGTIPMCHPHIHGSHRLNSCWLKNIKHLLHTRTYISWIISWHCLLTSVPRKVYVNLIVYSVSLWEVQTRLTHAQAHMNGINQEGVWDSQLTGVLVCSALVPYSLNYKCLFKCNINFATVLP